MMEVLKCDGPLSIQDQGRNIYRHQGIPIGGVMDSQAAMMANSLLGNHPDFAVLECCLKGPKLEFSKPTHVVISGASAKILLNGINVHENQIIAIQEKDVLEIGYLHSGNYLYLAIQGGFQTEMVLGSRSQFENITANSRILKGARISYKTLSDIPKINTKLKYERDESSAFQVYPGPDYVKLSEQQKAYLNSISFRITTDISRIGFKLDSEDQMAGGEITSSAVQPGTIQWTPSGKLMVMMRDCPVTGGYLRVFQLEEKDLNRMVQKRIGEEVSFVIQ